jgi:DNA-binding response OmpR family regulator
MDAIGRLARGVAHDFNNLLTVILGNASLLLAKLPRTDPNVPGLTALEASAVRAGELVEQLQRFSGQTPLQLEPVNLSTSIQETVAVLRPMSDPSIVIDAQPAPGLWTVQADPGQLAEMLWNLCFNAREAMPDGGQLHLQTANIRLTEEDCQARPQARPGEFVRLSVRDTGRGIAPEVQARMFEPFFTTKEVGKASGLGLALVFGIVAQHHGWVECYSAVGQGTTFDIYLPRYGHETLITPAPVTALAPRGAHRTILLADEEPMIRDLGRIILEDCGYQVLLAEDGVQAVEIYQRDGHRIDTVVLDATLPRLSGMDAFRQILEINPAARGCISSGYGAEELPGFDPRTLAVIRKPYRPEELASTVRAVLEQPGAPRKDKLLVLLNELEGALARDVSGREPDWLEELAQILTRVEQVLQQHAADSEAFDGLFAEVDGTRASLARQVNVLYQRSAAFLVQVGDLQRELQAALATASEARNGGPDLHSLRAHLKQFLTALQKHRQEEMDLVLDSVTTDIGAGD